MKKDTMADAASGREPQVRDLTLVAEHRAISCIINCLQAASPLQVAFSYIVL